MGWSAACVIALGEASQPIEGSLEPFGGRGACPPEAPGVGELRPVGRVGHAGRTVIERVELPSPEMTRPRHAHLGWYPRDTATLVELDDVVHPD